MKRNIFPTVVGWSQKSFFLKLHESAFEDRKICELFCVTAGFWGTHNCLQRLCGSVLNLHSGCPLICTILFGILSFTLSFFFSYYALEVWKLSDPRMSLEFDSKISSKIALNSSFQRKALLAFALFWHMEGKMLTTAIPSSLLCVGVFANRMKGSIPALTIRASSKQRSLIQDLGKKYGCHHCGSKQWFVKSSRFIADHMPPTKIARSMTSPLSASFLANKVI